MDGQRRMRCPPRRVNSVSSRIAPITGPSPNGSTWCCGPYTATKQKYEEAFDKLGTSAAGKGRLWITDSKISHSRDTPDEKLGRIEWMKFTVEITLPRQ